MDRLRNRMTGLRVAAVGVGAAVLLAGCSGSVAPAPAPRKALAQVKVSMGYTQNVQFAPFYVAIKRGYYRRAGLNVSFNYQTEPDALTLLSNGTVDFVDSGGDEVMTARASGLHVRYVMTQYSRFPSALFFLKSTGIQRVADLRGKTIGVPGTYGASYYGLLALLGANGLTPKDVNVETIGYTQVTSVANGQVAAAMGYAPNEPVELRGQGKKVGEFDVYKWANIAGAGLATSDSMIAHKPQVVRAFVRATLHGLRWTLAHPGKAFTISRHMIPGITDLPLQRRVLMRAIHFWRPTGVPLGHMNAAVWRTTKRVLTRYNQLKLPAAVTTYYTNRFVKP